MATNLTVDSADNSSRWYITPGKTSAYDLQVHNDTDRAVLCRVTLASHPDTGSVKPSSLTLQARETRIVSVTFGPTAELPRDRKAVVLVKDAAGQVLRTIERDLVSGASTDATVDLSWKAPIVEDGKLCGFVLLCNIRSLSGSADEFTPEFAPHAALVFPQLSQVWLEPGDTARLELPIRWNRSSRDAEGWNHPRAIEASVAVSQGRRSGRLSWDVVQRTISDMLDRSDRSPVVERKAAAPSFASASAATPAKTSPPPPLTAVPNKPVAVVPEKPVAPVPEKVVAAAPDKPIAAAVPEKLVAVPDTPAASVDKPAAPNHEPVAAPDKAAAVAEQPVVAPSKLAAVPDKPVAEPAKPMAMPAKGAAAIDKRVTARTKETGTALVVVLKALGPAKIPAAPSSPASVAPAAAASTAVAASAIAAPVIAAATQAAPAAATVVAPAAAAATASPVVTPVITPGAFVATTTVIQAAAAAAAVAPAAATATIPDDIAQRRPSAQPQPQPKPIITDAPKPQAPEAPKRVSDISAELANKFDGYRPAFQLVNNQAASQTSATTGGGTAPHDSTLRVDDLDASIVGSGLNYARNGYVAEAPVRRSIPAGAWVAGIAVAAVLGFVLFRPHTAPTTTATNTAAAPVAAPAQHHNVAAPAHAAQSTHVVAHVATKPKVVAPPSPAAVAQTPAPTTAPVTHANVAPPPVATVAHAAPARQVVRRPPPVDRSALPNIDYVNAAYGRYGRAVRVDWSSTAQASADVQLTDARGTLIGERTVGPSRSFVVVGLPRGYHGGIFVQVSVTGYHSERVVQTSSLSPF